MKKLSVFCLLTVSMLFGASCEPPAANSVANANKPAANSNTSKPVAAAPTKESLFEMDKRANEAWIKNDTAYFEGMLSDKFVSYNNGQRSDKASELAMLRSAKCDMKSWSLEDPQMSKINDDLYVVSYKGNYDGTCTWDGKTETMPKLMRAVSIWAREGETWKGVYHNEAPIIDPNSPPSSAAKSEPKSDEPKKNEPAPAKPAGDANTDALMKMHQAGWEAFKTRDAKWFNENLASNFTLVDPMGNWVPTKADAIKLWTETMKCEGVTNVKTGDGTATAISPTVEILTLKGTADGTCNGQKNGDMWQSAVYVKEGDAWKLAFMFETAAM